MGLTDPRLQDPGPWLESTLRQTAPRGPAGQGLAAPTSPGDRVDPGSRQMEEPARTAGAIRGRAARVIHIINAEMENYEAGVYTEKVLEATQLLSETGNHGY